MYNKSVLKEFCIRFARFVIKVQQCTKMFVTDCR